MGKPPSRDVLDPQRSDAPTTARPARARPDAADSSVSRKDIRPSAPYRRSRDTSPPGAVPLAKIQLVPAPVAPPVPAPVGPPVPAPAAATLVESTRATAFQTSLGFASAALAALPHPAELVIGTPLAFEPPPGPAPSGDARSLRAGDQFALVYRHGAAVVSRRGTLGLRGTWNVVDYPSATLAAHAYALECSRLLAQGFRDG